MLKKAFLTTSSVTLALALAAPAIAQDFEDEIIVTATKRPQTLQETPVAVSVVPEEVIEQSAILDIKDLQSVVPSLRVTQLQSSQNTNFVIRGFGNGANNAGIEPAVGVFIDGVYRSRAAAQIGDLPVLERVEVLKGPQSTLYGKNSSAGVISIVTAKPSYETTGYIEGGIGNYNMRNLRGYYSTGGADGTFAFSIGGGVSQRDGYAESANASSPDLNDRDRWNLRGQAMVTFDNLEARIIADISEIDEQCCLTGFLDALNGLDPNGTAIGGVNVIGAITAQPPFGLGGRVNDPFDYVSDFNGDFDNFVTDKGVSLHLDWNMGDIDVTSITAYRNNDGGYDTEIDYTSAEIANSVRVENDIDTFTQEIRFAGATGGLDWLLGGFYFNESIDSFSSLDYGPGMRGYADILVAGLGAPGLLGSIEAANGFDVGETFFQAGQGTTEIFTQDNEAFSGFGQFDLEVTEGLTLSAGANYTVDNKNVALEQVRHTDVFSQINLSGAEGINTLLAGGLVDNFGAFSQSCIDPTTGGLFAMPLAFTPENVGLVSQTACFVPNFGQFVPGSFAYQGFFDAVLAGSTALAQSPNNPLLGLTAFQFLPPLTGFPNQFEDGKSRDTDLSYSFKAAYDVSDNINVYASYGTGFKGTSWNLSRDSRPATLFAFANPNEGLGTRFAGPEDTTVIEAGLKARFENGAVNLAVFDQSIKGFQGNLFQGTGFVLTNAGEQSARGFEWDATYNPIDSLRLDFSGTYIDPEFDSFENAPGPFGSVIDRTGDTPAGIHEWSINVAATYNHNFSNGMEGYLRGSFLYESPTQIVPNFAGISQLESQGFIVADTVNGFTETEREVKTFDASAGLKMENGLSLQVWGRNIFNDEYLMSAFPGVAQPGTVYGYPNPPRTFGANVRYEF